MKTYIAAKFEKVGLLLYLHIQQKSFRAHKIGQNLPSRQAHLSFTMTALQLYLKWWRAANVMALTKSGHHVLATTRQSCAMKKGTFSQIFISLCVDFGLFFSKKKWIFGPFLHFLAKLKNSAFSIIPAGTRSIVNMGYFFGGQEGPTKSCWPWSKIKGSFTIY